MVGSRSAGSVRPGALARILVFTACSLCGVAEARADWLITPFFGMTFGVDTAYVALETDSLSQRHVVFGAAGGWLGSHIFGVEGELAFVPGFFESDEGQNLVTSSHVNTLFGNVIAAMPLSISRDSLRPYLLGGIGLIDVNYEDRFALVQSDKSLGLQLGGGALGSISNRTALRFDLRNIRTLSRTTDVLGVRRSKLGFWRATIGVAIRY